MSAPEPDPRVRRLARQLRAVASLLAQAARRFLRAAVRARATFGGVEALILLRPMSALPSVTPSPQSAGGWFSPLEQRIWDALAGGPLLGREIADRLGMSNSPSLRAILGNLVARGCLIAEPGRRRGYARATPNHEIASDT
jgi:hypothetical protein